MKWQKLSALKYLFTVSCSYLYFVVHIYMHVDVCIYVCIMYHFYASIVYTMYIQYISIYTQHTHTVGPKGNMGLISSSCLHFRNLAGYLKYSSWAINVALIFSAMYCTKQHFTNYFQRSTNCAISEWYSVVSHRECSEY